MTDNLRAHRPVVNLYTVHAASRSSGHGHMTVYEEQYYSNNIRKLSAGEGTWVGTREIPRPIELYHKIIIIKN